MLNVNHLKVQRSWRCYGALLRVAAWDSLCDCFAVFFVFSFLQLIFTVSKQREPHHVMPILSFMRNEQRNICDLRDMLSVYNSCDAHTLFYVVVSGYAARHRYNDARSSHWRDERVREWAQHLRSAMRIFTEIAMCVCVSSESGHERKKQRFL